MPLEGLLGGVMIGLGAAVMMLAAGRIAGVSGMAARAMMLARGGAPISIAWLFVVGIILGALTVQAITGSIEARFPSSPLLLILGGLLVGFGTRLGSGCTSGHGVCGMSRLSRRSLVATATFIVSGIVTVALANQLGWGW
jgi:uncharacterized membrane protein YedE/YeeE